MEIGEPKTDLFVEQKGHILHEIVTESAVEVSLLLLEVNEDSLTIRKFVKHSLNNFHSLVYWLFLLEQFRKHPIGELSELWPFVGEKSCNLVKVCG